MTLTEKARQNRHNAVSAMRARQSNIFAADFAQPTRRSRG